MNKLIFILLILAFPSLVFAQEAVLFLSSSQTNVGVGNSFWVDLKLQSPGQVINAAQASLTFPNDILKVDTLSKSGSIFSLWPEESVFSNANSKISFTGGVPAPGFSGVGTIISIKFRARKQGKAEISFTQGAVLAADGKGTNILKEKRGITIFVKEGVIKEEIILPSGPAIFSPTHPNENNWYSNSYPKFQWDVTKGITGIAYELDKSSSTIPQSSSLVINSKSYEDLEEGVWYFHLRFKDKKGWGDTGHYRIKIDKTAPLPFDVSFSSPRDRIDPQPLLYFKTTDELSGLSHYELKIGDGEFFEVSLNETDPFKMPLQMPGLRRVVVRAVDRAGNTREAVVSFEIESIPPPEIILFSPVYNAGEEFFYVEGKALPQKTVIFFLEKKKDVKQWEVPSDKEGLWFFKTEELFKSGNYIISARTKDERGAISDSSERYKVKIILAGFSLGPIILSFRGLLLVLIAIFLLLAAVFFYFLLFKWKRFKDRTEKETKEASRSLKKNFDSLKKEISSRVRYFDSKPGLNAKERKLRDELLVLLEESEKAVSKEIKDIEKELEKGY